MHNKKEIRIFLHYNNIFSLQTDEYLKLFEALATRSSIILFKV